MGYLLWSILYSGVEEEYINILFKILSVSPTIFRSSSMMSSFLKRFMAGESTGERYEGFYCDISLRFVRV